MRATLDGEPPVALGTSYLYGRGEGSNAKEQAWVHVRIDAATAAARGAAPARLTVAIEDLDGRPLDDPDLELVEHELRPL